MGVTELSTVKWLRLTIAFQAINSARRAHWPVIAQLMAELRSEFSSNSEFGHACFENNIELNQDDRAAFVKMGQWTTNDLTDAMAVCTRFSPQHFVREVQDMIPCSSRDEDAAELRKNTESDVIPGKTLVAEEEIVVISVTNQYKDLWMKVKRTTKNDKSLRLVNKLRDVDPKGILLETLTGIGWSYVGNQKDAKQAIFNPRLLFPNLPKDFASARAIRLKRKDGDYTAGVASKIKREIFDKAEAFRAISIAVKDLPAPRAEIVAARLWAGEPITKTPTVALKVVPEGVPVYRVNGHIVFPARIDPTPENIRIAEAALQLFKAQDRELVSHGLSDGDRALVFSQWQTWMRVLSELAARVILNCSQALDQKPIGDGKTELPNDHDFKAKYGL